MTASGVRNARTLWRCPQGAQMAGGTLPLAPAPGACRIAAAAPVGR